jgi:hypothetical protein
VESFPRYTKRENVLDSWGLGTRDNVVRWAHAWAFWQRVCLKLYRDDENHGRVFLKLHPSTERSVTSIAVTTLTWFHLIWTHIVSLLL